MKLKKFIVLSFCLSLITGAALAEEQVLTELKLTPVENVVPTHYQAKCNMMNYMLNDPFDYQIDKLTHPMSTTPAPILEQIDSTMFVPASRMTIDGTEQDFNGFLNGVVVEDFIWDNEYANSVVFDMTIPSGQMLKYVDLWGRSDKGSIDRIRNLVVFLYKGDLCVKSKVFHCSFGDDLYPFFARVDMAEQGFTDNLLTDATRLVIRHSDDTRTVFTNLAEIRVATEPNPYTGTDIPTLLSDTHTGELYVNSDMSVGVTGDYGASLYLIKSSLDLTKENILSENEYKFLAETDSLYAISSVGIALGDYKWVAIDLAGNISVASAILTIAKDEKKPVLTLDNTEYLMTSWINVTCSELATVYIVPNGTVADTAAIHKAAKKQAEVETGNVLMSTYKIEGGDYLIYAVDKSANVSESISISLLPLEATLYENIEITAAVGSKPNYGVGGVHSDPKNVYDDGFAYNPNNPYPDDAKIGTVPDCIFRHGPDYDPGIDTNIFYGLESGDPWFGVSFNMTIKQKLTYVDFWGRSDDDVHEGLRHENLFITITDTISGNSWTSPKWSGINRQYEVPCSYGRFYFATANVQPQSLLSTANYMEIRHEDDYGDGLTICELRIGSKEWVNSTPEADAGADQTVKPGTLVTLDASATYDIDSAFQTLSYAWSPPSGITLSDETAIKPTFTAPEGVEAKSYVFRLMVTDSKGEKSQRVSVKITVDPAASLDDIAIDGFNVYPNPSSSVFYLNLLQTTTSSLVKLTDLTGNVLYHQSAKAGGLHTIDVSNLSAGLCILSVENDGKQVVRRVVIN